MPKTSPNNLSTRKHAGARSARAAPRTLQEIDFLLLADDEARQGAPRAAEKKADPSRLRRASRHPPALIELPTLASAAEHGMEEKDTEEELRVLFAPGSYAWRLEAQRLPSGKKDGHLAIAKFRRKDDEIRTGGLGGGRGFDYAGLSRTRATRSRSCCLARFTETSASGSHLFKAPLPTPPILCCLRLAASLAVATQDSRPSESRQDLLRGEIDCCGSHTSRWATW
jgi:hypothetical protein